MAFNFWRHNGCNMNKNINVTTQTNMGKNSIPKKIHYVWMGNTEKGELETRCIESWKKYMPDYDIIEWNETNFDIEKNAYIQEAYKQKKWAFVSDAVRTYVLKEYGGIYFDTDVELFCKPDNIFEDANVVLGFDNRFLLSSAVMAAKHNHPIFEKLWNCYENSHFINAVEESTINTKLTLIVVDYTEKRRLVNGKYNIKDMKIMPRIYFSNSVVEGLDPVFAVHHFKGTWKTKTQLTFMQYLLLMLKFKLLRVMSVFIGNKLYLDINDTLWRKALYTTKENLKKGVRIYKSL